MYSEVFSIFNIHIFYYTGSSFKYGTFEGERNGRFFTDFTPDTFSDFIKDVEQIRIEEEWITDDVRPGKEKEKWLNLILKKTGF